MLLTKAGKIYKAFGLAKDSDSWYVVSQTFKSSIKPFPDSTGPFDTKKEALEAAEGRVRAAVRMGYEPASVTTMRQAFGVHNFDPFAGFSPLPGATAEAIEQERRANLIRKSLQAKKAQAKLEADTAELQRKKVEAEGGKVKAENEAAKALQEKPERIDRENIRPTGTIESALYQMPTSRRRRGAREESDAPPRLTPLQRAPIEKTQEEKMEEARDKVRKENPEFTEGQIEQRADAIVRYGSIELD